MKTVEQIAAELQGYDPTALSVPAVHAFLEQLATPLAETEEVALFEALGRVLAEDLVSPFSVPPRDNSAMDGYAFAHGTLPADGAALTVVGTALAGKAWAGVVQPGQCLRITTGALMPEGTDTVVPQELAQVDGDQVTVRPALLRRGDNRRLAGEDLMQGQPALCRGDTLGPAALGLMASLGLARARVFRRLRVAYLSTGDELLSLGELPAGQPLPEGKIYDSNRYTVFGMLTRLGCEVIDLGVVRDEPVALEAAFREAAGRADAVITSGGVSVGEADYTKAMMKKLAADSGGVAFWRIAMRPGRPMAVGRISGLPGPGSTEESAASPSAAGTGRYQKHSAVLFGLPGTAVAVMVTFLAFVRPALLRMMGSSSQPLPLLRAHSLEPMRKKPGRTEYQRGVVSTAPDGSLQVRTTGNQGSGVLSSMVQGNGLIVLHHGQGNVAVGDEVDVMMFDGAL